MTFANRADPDQMLQNAASDQGLHCSFTGISVQNTLKVKAFTRNPYSKKWTCPNDNDCPLVKKG